MYQLVLNCLKALEIDQKVQYKNIESQQKELNLKVIQHLKSETQVRSGSLTHIVTLTYLLPHLIP